MKVVYDFENCYPSLFLEMLLISVLGFGYFFYNKKFIAYNQKNHFGILRENGMMAGIATGIVVLIIYLTILYGSLSNYYKTKSQYDSRNYNIVAGYVSKFNPMPVTGHANEQFNVDNVHFAFSDYDLSDYGYNNARSHGGVIKDSLFVKIIYVSYGEKNIILKLEVEQNDKNGSP